MVVLRQPLSSAWFWFFLLQVWYWICYNSILQCCKLSINWDQRNENIAPFFTYEGEILVVSYVFLWKALVFIGSHKQFDCFSSVWLILNVFSFMMLSEVREKERKICKKKEMSWKMKKFIVADSCWDDAMLDAVINPETPFTVTKNQKNDVVQ